MKGAPGFEPRTSKFTSQHVTTRPRQLKSDSTFHEAKLLDYVLIQITY